MGLYVPIIQRIECQPTELEVGGSNPSGHTSFSPPQNRKHPDYKDFLDIDIAELVHYTEIHI